MSPGARAVAGATVLCLLLASLTVLARPTALAPEAWSWLAWGREAADLDPFPVDPAFRPLPVLVATVLAPIGDAAPNLWLILTRAGAVAAVLAAALLAHRLAAGPALPPGSYVLPVSRRRPARWWQVGLLWGRRIGRRWWQPAWTPRRTSSTGEEPQFPAPGSRDLPRRRAARRAAALAAVASVGTIGLGRSAWHGEVDAWAAALALLTVERAVAGRHRTALSCAAALCLLRVEAWPFLLLYAARLWRTHPSLRGGVAASLLPIPALWLGPVLRGGGDLLHAHPSELLAPLGDAVTTPLLGVLAAAAIGAATVRPGVALPLAAGLAWSSLVVLTAQIGLASGDGAHLPGAVSLGVAGAVAIAGIARRRDPRWALAAGVLALLAVGQAAQRVVTAVPDDRDRSAGQERLQDDLRDAIARAGGHTGLRTARTFPAESRNHAMSGPSPDPGDRAMPRASCSNSS